ncbi:excalibur calcium-binding domain-containing protein [Nocardia sp. NBC_00511]
MLKKTLAALAVTAFATTLATVATGTATADVYYKNCAAARAAGAAPILRGEPGYRPALDRDNDGIACE